MDKVNEVLNQYKLALGLSLVGLILILGGILSPNLPNSPNSSPKDFPDKSIIKPEENGLIKVDVSGAVNKPGVYSLAKDSRIEDVIKEAGGFLENVNTEYVTKSLNLSQKIVDGQKIYIPFENESYSAPTQVAGVSNVSASGKIGINSASGSQLEELPGVGPATATKIIKSRPYADINELVSKKAVGKATFEKIKDLIDLN